MALSVSQNMGKTKIKALDHKEQQDLKVNAANVVNGVTRKQNAENG